MLRLFVGLALPDTLRQAFSRICQGLPDARWVDPDNYHLTLRFIGEVDRHEAADIDDTLQRIEAPAFDLTVNGLGTFGQGRKTRALWARVNASAGLSHLQSKIESAVVRAGQPPESRKFVPHVTLARFRTAQPNHIQAFVERNGLFHEGPIAMNRYVLFESHLGKGGAHYEEVADYPLAPPASAPQNTESTAARAQSAP